MVIDLESGLRAFSDGYLRLLSDPRVVSMWRLVMAEAIEHPHVTQVFYETGPQQTLDSLTRFLEHHADELDVEDFGKAARTLFGMTADQFQSRIMLGIDSGVPAARQIGRNTRDRRCSRRAVAGTQELDRHTAPSR